jgi:hypothetical protein
VSSPACARAAVAAKNAANMNARRRAPRSAREAPGARRSISRVCARACGACKMQPVSLVARAVQRHLSNSSEAARLEPAMLARRARALLSASGLG